MKVLRRYEDADGDEWWELLDGSYMLAGRSSTGAMGGWTRDEVESKFGELTELET